MVVDEHFEMRPYFLVEVGVERLRPKRREDTRGDRAQAFHVLPSRSRVTIATMRVQFFASAARCFSPARVIA